jgi:hypothetical protein
MGEPHDHGAHTMHAGRCQTFEELLGLRSLSGGRSQEPHSDAIGSRQDPVQDLAWIWKEADE